MVGSVEPAGIATDAAHFGGHGGQPRDRNPRDRSARIPRVLAAALPEVDLDECEMLYQFDESGAMTGVLIRNTATRATVARFDLADLTRLVASSGASGVLFERRG
jgi:hypothetical protein